MAIKLIVGLQNPGSSYENTRHNIGGCFVETLANRHKASFRLESKLHGSIANFDLDHHACRALLPTTFMNQSGLPVKAVSQFYRIEPEEILVIHDDLDLDCGRVKLKTDGGNGGHNGLRDIIAHLGSSAFHRLRIGIGHPGQKDLVLHYVLGKPAQAERELLQDAIDRGLEIIPLLLAGNISQAMNLLNS